MCNRILFMKRELQMCIRYCQYPTHFPLCWPQGAAVSVDLPYTSVAFPLRHLYLFESFLWLYAPQAIAPRGNLQPMRDWGCPCHLDSSEVCSTVSQGTQWDWAPVAQCVTCSLTHLHWLSPFPALPPHSLTILLCIMFLQNHLHPHHCCGTALKEAHIETLCNAY